MTDLGDFGVDVPDADRSASSDAGSSTGSGYGKSHSYRRGRCRGIAGGERRCRSPCSGGDLCHTHSREANPLTIDSEPRRLIRWLGRVDGKAARCRALKNTGERCENGCGPLERFCGTHDEMDNVETVDELEDDELDVDLIQAALDAVAAEEDER